MPGAATLTQPLTTATPARFSSRPLVLLLLLAALLAFAIRLREPLSVPMPEYLADAQQWQSAPGQSMTDTFTPLAYPLFIAPALHVGGLRAVVAAQALLYLATVAVAFFLLNALGATARLAFVGSLPILFYPEFFESITKIWDVGLSAFLFLLLALCCVRLQRGPTPTGGVILGIVFAAGLFCRPNFALLAVAILYAVLTAEPRRNLPKALSTLGITAAITIVVYALAGIAAHGKPFLPSNGAYNLYVGNNPFSAQALLEKLNGEPSLYPAMRSRHPDLTPRDAGPDFFHQDSLSPLYSQDALALIFHQPAEEARLIAVKLLTFFRPDTKVHSLRSKAGLFKAILALPALLFLAALLPIGRPPLTRTDALLLIIDAAYILPFLLTNADPRFRTPLDALLLLHIIRLLSIRFNPSATSSPMHHPAVVLP